MMFLAVVALVMPAIFQITSRGPTVSRSVRPLTVTSMSCFIAASRSALVGRGRGQAPARPERTTAATGELAASLSCRPAERGAPTRSGRSGRGKGEGTSFPGSKVQALPGVALT